MRTIQMQRAGMLSLASVTSIMAAGAACLLSGPAYARPEAGGKVLLTQALKRTVLVFPLDVPASVPNKDEVREVLTDTAVSRLMASGSYSVVRFHRTLPTVARLHLDQQLTDTDIAEPFGEDNTKATKIAKMTGYEVALVGTVDEYQFNEADKSVDMVVSGRLLDTKTGKFVSTPVTLKASSSKGGTGKEPDRALEAARTAGQQLMQKLVPIASTTTTVTPPTTQQQTPKNTGTPGAAKKRRDSGLLLGILAVAVGLGIGLSGRRGGGGTGGGGIDNPPPPP